MLSAWILNSLSCEKQHTVRARRPNFTAYITLRHPPKMFFGRENESETCPTHHRQDTLAEYISSHPCRHQIPLVLRAWFTKTECKVSAQQLRS